MSQMDEFGRHEVLHMASFFAYTVDLELCDHEQIRSNRKWSSLANKAARALADLYQSIGTDTYNARHMDESATSAPAPIMPERDSSGKFLKKLTKNETSESAEGVTE